LGIKNDNKTLINGQSVKVEIKGLDFAKNIKPKVNTVTSQALKVFLSSVKITPRGNFVFTINEDFTLKAVNVELGRIVNDMVEIRTGLNAEDRIVKDARGLKEGNKVEIKNL
jgi:multidrug efflux pump subunit AcrA (membrane-fusion protein)